MKGIYNNKKIRNIVVGLLLVVGTAVLCSFVIINKFPKVYDRYVVGTTDKNIDIDSIKLTSHLTKLTNINDYNNLKDDMSGSLENDILSEAVKRGIVVKQGISIDVQKLIDLYNLDGSMSNADLIKEAINEKIIKNYGESTINSIDIDKFIALKNNMSGDSDEDIVDTALKEGIIKGDFNYSDLKINTNIDLNTMDISQFGSYNMNDFLSLDDIKNSEVIQNNMKTIKDIGIDGGQIEAQYNVALKENPVNIGDDEEIPMTIAILVDVSNLKNNFFQNSVDNYIFNNKSFINNLPTDVDIKVIPYHISGGRNEQTGEKFDTSANKDIKDKLHVAALNITNSASENSSDTIDRAIKDADCYLQYGEFSLTDKAKEGRKTKDGSKAILIFGENINDSEYNKCFDKDNNFIIKNNYLNVTIYYGEYGYGDTLKNMSAPYNSNLKKIHDRIGGSDSTFYVSYKESPTETSHNDINSPLHQLDGLPIGEKAARDLLSGKYSNYVSINGTLNFNMGKYIKISDDDTNGNKLTTSVNNGENHIQLKLSDIKLQSDYAILGDRNLAVNSIFIDSLIDSIIASTSDGHINNNRVMYFLKDRLNDIKIDINESDAANITKGMYENVLSKTVDELNGDNVISNLMDSNSYNKIKYMKSIEILKSSNEDYAKAAAEIRSLLRANLDNIINEVLGNKVEEAYVGKELDSNKETIVNGILNNTDISTIIKSITKKDNTKVNNIIIDIKKKFNNNSTPNDISIYLKTDTKKELNHLGYMNKTLKEILDLSAVSDEMKNAQNDIKSVLKQLVNEPLKLTKLAYIVSEDSNKVKFIIEPTLEAVFEESLEELVFTDNKNADIPDNNYIEYTLTNNSASSTNKGAIDETPILKLNRVLTNKNHIIYKELSHEVNSYGEEIRTAKGIDEGVDGFNFAKGSTITGACNIMDISGDKTLQLEFNYNEGTINNKIEPNSLVQVPKLYKYNYTNNKLDYIGEFTVDAAKNNLYSIKVSDKMRTNYIVLYSMKTEKNYSKNIVRVSGLSKGNGTLNITSKDKLPDLY